MHDVAADLQPPPAHRRGSRPVILAVIAAGMLVAAAAIAVIALRAHQGQPTAQRVSGIPASVHTSLANLMDLTPVPEQAAPGFTLTDQADSGFGDTLTPGTGFTARVNVSPTPDMELLIEDQAAGQGATPAATTGTGASTVWLMATLVLKHA